MVPVEDTVPPINAAAAATSLYSSIASLLVRLLPAWNLSNTCCPISVGTSITIPLPAPTAPRLPISLKPAFTPFVNRPPPPTSLPVNPPIKNLSAIISKTD